VVIDRSRRLRWLLIILAASVLLRVGVAFYYGDWVPPRQDDNSYSQLAWRLATGHGYSFERSWYPFTPAETPTAHWSFLYTAFVAAVYAVAGFRPLVVRLAGAVLGGVLLPWMAYRLARRLFPKRDAVPLLAAACTAVYAFFILFAARIMTETFFIVSLMWLLERAITVVESVRAGEKPATSTVLGLGAALGLAALFRQSILPWGVVLFLWLLWVGRETGALRRTVGTLAQAAVVALLFILPFTLRNYRAYGDFLLLNSNAGYAMYAAQHPLHGSEFEEHRAMPLPEELLPVESMTEPEWDRALMERGIAFVADEPFRYLLLSLSRVPDFFEFWPTDTSFLHNLGRLVSFTLFLPFMIGGLWLALRRVAAWRSPRRFAQSPLALVVLFMIFYSVLHILTWAMPRYRLPVDAVAMPFVGLALHELLLWLHWRLSGSAQP